MSLIVPFNDNLSALVGNLDVEVEQREFIGDFSSVLNDISDRFTGHVIMHDGKPAGFFIIDLDYPNQHEFSGKGSVGLRSFFIASPFQGKGLAKRALQELSAYLRAQGIQAEKVFLTVNCRNTAAASLYKKMAFMMTENSTLAVCAVPNTSCKCQSPNYAIKGTSVETLDSSELSSGASVPYLGC